MIFDDEIPAALEIPTVRRGNNQYELFWTEERLEQLKFQWAAGDSGATIAQAMGTTRNAIIGKAHRLRLPARKASTRWKNPISALKKVNTRHRNSNTKRLNAALRTHIYEAASSLPPDVPDNAVSLLQLEPHHCRWPCSGEGADVVFCGGSVHPRFRFGGIGALPSFSYCARHSRMAYEPPKRRMPAKYWNRNGVISAA